MEFLTGINLFEDGTLETAPHPAGSGKSAEEIMLFAKPGRENAEAVAALAKKAAREHHIGHIVLASNTGYTAGLFLDVAREKHIVCVAHAFGSRKPGENLMAPEERARLGAAGIDVLSTTHVLSGAERAFSRHFQGIGPVEVMARTLYLFGQGAKVCVEVAVMALDAGLIPHGEDIVAVGGTAHGADTALVLRPAHAANILETKIRAVLCKPWDF